MKNSVRIALIGILTLSVSPAVFSASEKILEDVSIRIFYGEIITIDAGARTLVLRTDDEKDQTLTVPAQAKIFRGLERIDFTQLEKGDVVTMKYFKDPKGGVWITSITVENPVEQ